jgi:hypothetical protein
MDRSQKYFFKPGVVPHTYNPNYMVGMDREGHGSKPACKKFLETSFQPIKACLSSQLCGKGK